MFGRKLKNLREQAGLTQEELAKKFNLLKSSISMYENNIRFPNIELIKDFAVYFNVSIDYLLDHDVNNVNDKELQEQEVLKDLLIKNGYMKNGEDLTKEEFNRLMNFVKNNKDLLRGK